VEPNKSGHWIRSLEYHGTGRFCAGLFDLGKQQYPLSPFDTSHPNEWINQDLESVRDGQLSYIRHVQLYFMDRDFYDIKHKDLQSSMTVLKDKLNDEQLLFFYDTGNIPNQCIEY
jgi:hypothetical protein